jgi:hypothetical protein
MASAQETDDETVQYIDLRSNMSALATVFTEYLRYKFRRKTRKRAVHTQLVEAMLSISFLLLVAVAAWSLYKVQPEDGVRYSNASEFEKNISSFLKAIQEDTTGRTEVEKAKASAEDLRRTLANFQDFVTEKNKQSGASTALANVHNPGTNWLHIFWKSCAGILRFTFDFFFGVN